MNYAKQIEEKIKKEYPYRIELHAHTSPVSPCSQVKPSDEIKAFHDAGFDAMAITNHFFPHLLNCSSKEEYIEKYKKDYYDALNEGEKFGMKVYLGAELRFPNENNNDYLIYGWNFDELSDIYDYLDGNLETFIKEYKKDYMFILQAHPFRDNMERANPELLDAIEGFNMHPNHNSRVAIASEFAEDNGKIITVGTDFHHMGHQGLSATRTRVLPADTAELIKLLKSDDFLIEIAGKILV